MKIQLSQDRSKLLESSKEWDFSNPPGDIREIAHSMVELMLESKGLGLAYNQTDLEGNYRIFSMRGSPENFVLINPRLVNLSGENVSLEEGCLSWPGFAVSVIRPTHCRVRFEGPDGQTYTHQFTGMTARVVQHEMCHLNGESFYKGVSRLKLNIAIKKAGKRGFDYSGLGLLKNCS